jgi:DNA-directed RNA polymerase subunit H (RpoH/RPB5)
MSSNNKTISIFKSRTTIIELLDERGYDIAEYESFNVNEVDAMVLTGQLDMILSKKAEPVAGGGSATQKVYVKYYLDSKQLRAPALDDIVEDLFISQYGGGARMGEAEQTDGENAETTLTKNDTLVIIVENEPNDSIISKVGYLYEKDGIFVVIFNIRRLQFNILKHRLVPPIHILSPKEKDEFMAKYNINSLGKIPEISRFDPQAQAVLLRPGEICRFERESLSALRYYYYRVCV